MRSHAEHMGLKSVCVCVRERERERDPPREAVASTVRKPHAVHIIEK